MKEHDFKNDQEAIRRIIRHGKPDSPSRDFTARLMENILTRPDPALARTLRRQWILLLSSAALVIFMLYFPIWTWLGLEFTPADFILYYAGKYIAPTAQWIGQGLGSLGNKGIYLLLIPVTCTVILLSVFELAVNRRQKQLATA